MNLGVEELEGCTANVIDDDGEGHALSDEFAEQNHTV
jgi:hypothetical protein